MSKQILLIQGGGDLHQEDRTRVGNLREELGAGYEETTDEQQIKHTCVR